MRNLFLPILLAVAVSLAAVASYDAPRHEVCHRGSEATGAYDEFDELEWRDLWIESWAEYLNEVQPPATGSVIVEVVWLGYRPGLMGYTTRLPDGGLYIALGSHLSVIEAWDTITHEWAHAVAFPDSIGRMEDAIEVGGHTAYWGVAYSDVYNDLQRMPRPDWVDEWLEERAREEEEEKAEIPE